MIVVVTVGVVVGHKPAGNKSEPKVHALDVVSQHGNHILKKQFRWACAVVALSQEAAAESKVVLAACMPVRGAQARDSDQVAPGPCSHMSGCHGMLHSC